MPSLGGLHREIVSSQINEYKLKDVKISISTQLREILYIETQDMLILSYTIHRTATISFQMKEPVPEIMDTM
jgi:hypothetical protein